MGIGIWFAIIKIFWSEQLGNSGHVDTIEAGCDNRRTGDSDMNFFSIAQFFDAVQQDSHRGRADDGIFYQENPYALMQSLMVL